MPTNLKDLPALDDDPTPADIMQLADLLHGFNVERTGFGDGRRYGLYIRDDKGEIIGGVDGWTWGGTCYVTTLFVPRPLRLAGLGTRLMGRVEAEAKQRGCNRIILRTDDFQAPGFYRKLGFEQVAEVAYVGPHCELTFTKSL